MPDLQQTSFPGDSVKRMSIIELANTVSGYAQAGDTNKAIELYRQWLTGNEFAPASPLVYYNLSALLLAANQTDESIRLLTHSLTVKANLTPAYQLLE